MRTTKRTVARAVAALMVVAMVLVSCGGTPELTDGTYTGHGKGHHGDIVAEVTIESGNITAIEVVENPENKVLSASVYETLTAEMIKANGADVDAVSGASDTSSGFIAAVDDALSQAGAAQSSGGDGDNGADDATATVPTSGEVTEATYDVVVIGAGGAGLVAGVTAAEDGATVVVLEKMPAPGGNTLISGGGLNVPGSWMQERHGIQDSVERYTRDTIAGGDEEGEPELVATMAENALPAALWLRDEVGMTFLDRVQQFGGHSVPRAIIPEGNSGEQMIMKLMERGRELGMTLKTGTEATHLIVDENGDVSGVRARGIDGGETIFHADKGVVIAAGGFGSNIEMRMEYNAEYDEEYMSTCLPGITGDGIKLADEADADFTDMSFIQTYPTCNPETGIISYVANSRFYGAILVNAEGERFVNEMGRRDNVSRAILDQSGKTAYLFWDAGVESKSGMIDLHPQEFEAMQEAGLIVRADSVAEAATYFDVDAEALEASVERYNSFAQTGNDADYGRGGSLASFTDGPFYLQRVVPSVHHTMGGIRIDTAAQVLNADGDVIPGLYAAGEVTGGVHGTNRLGGNAITDCVVFGRIAGHSAASR